MKAKSFTVSAVYLLGMLGVFIGERVIGAGQARGVLTVLGLVAVAAAFVLRVGRASAAAADRKPVERAFLRLYGVGLVALVLYFAQSDLWTKVASHLLEQSSPKLATVLAALWPALAAASLLPVILGELSYAAMALAPVVEGERVRDAVLSGLGLAGTLVFAFAIAYVANARDAKWDLSYFRTARAGQASRRIVEALDEPLEVSVFFPPANEVRDEVMEYLTDLGTESKLLQVHSYDQAVDLAKAKELNVTGNGAIVIQRKTRKEQLTLGLDIDSARSQLAKLDGDFQKKLLLTVKSKRTIYLVGGHGERTEDHAGPNDQRATIRAFKDLLQGQNYEVKSLTAADGLANEVPKDAAAVALLGPQSALLPEESDALRRYLDHGGRALIALDPEASVDLEGVLSRLGVKFMVTALANDQVFVRLNHQVSDHRVLATSSVSSHASVTTLSRLGNHAALFLPGAGWLDDRKDRPQDVTVDYTVRARPETFNDLNNNFEFDPPAEQRKPWNLVAAVSGKKANVKPEDQLRAVVVADSDLFGDLLIENNIGNAYFALDAMKWLLGEESTAGEVTSEEDKAIEHTRKQDVVWFYSTIFLVPAAVLGVGLGVTRRRGRKAARGEGAK